MTIYEQRLMRAERRMRITMMMTVLNVLVAGATAYMWTLR